MCAVGRDAMNPPWCLFWYRIMNVGTDGNAEQSGGPVFRGGRNWIINLLKGSPNTSHWLFGKPYAFAYASSNRIGEAMKTMGNKTDSACSRWTICKPSALDCCCYTAGLFLLPNFGLPYLEAVNLSAFALFVRRHSLHPGPNTSLNLHLESQPQRTKFQCGPQPITVYLENCLIRLVTKNTIYDKMLLNKMPNILPGVLSGLYCCKRKQANTQL